MKTYPSSPYFDDFDPDNQFYQLLFRPGRAVQARELTQLQSILRDQFEKFGNHIFKHGSVVIPGNSLSDLAVPYVKVESLFNSVAIDPEQFLDEIVVGSVSGVEAVVKKVVPATNTDPIVFYLSYISGNTTTGDVIFRDGEELFVKQLTSIRANTAASSSTGVGSLAYINNGVYYINGTFVSVLEQSTVLSKFTSTPSCHVLLKIDETIVDWTDDETLLDNAQGSYNFAAPGADRAKISLTLTTLPLGSAITSDYVEIMRFDNGVLQEHAKTSKYSELEKSLARRTFDESGNYIVSGFEPTIREHLKVGNNGGVYTSGNIAKLVVDVSSGKGYVDGFEVEKISNTKIEIDKARTSSHILDTTVNLRPSFGQYLIVSDLIGGSSGFTKGLINLFNASNPGDGTATQVGTAKVIGIDYLDAGESQPNMYRLIVSDVALTGNYKFEDIGGIRYTSGRSAYVLNEYTIPVSSGGFTSGEIINHSSGRRATVKFYNASTSTVYAYKHSSSHAVPQIGDLVVGASSSTSATVTARRTIITIGNTGLVFKLPKNIPATLRDPDTNSYNLRYIVQKQLTMTVVAGAGSVSISSGTLDAIEEGTFVAIGPSGVINNSFFSISGNSIVTSACPQNGTVIIYTNVTKEDVFPKTKSLQTFTETITSPTATITLAKADVVSLTSVVDSLGNITSNYTLFNGQTDYEYGYGQLRLKDGRSAPSGNVTVSYSYYEHSGTGDFFCVDSYTSVPNFLENPGIYQSRSSSQAFDLSGCIDFRPLVNAASSDIVVDGTVFNTTLQYYVPRIDSLVLDAAGKLSIISGTPNEPPLPPIIPSGQFELNRFFIPEYTRKVGSVVSKRMSVERYTMGDIRKVVDRVGKIEDFATLTASELLVTKYNVVDAETGLDKYKTGYLIENFKQPFTLARTLSNDFAVTFLNDSMQPPHEPLACKLSLMETSSNYVIKNGYIMLPYTEEVFASQPLSSRVTNLNPFLMISWNGVLDVQPPSDTWVEMVDLPTVYESKTEDVVVNVYVDPPPPPTYKIVSNYNVIGEGDTVTFTVYTERVANGTSLYWTIVGDVATNDFTDSALSGSVTINNGTASFTKTTTADALTEGTERFRVQLRTGSTSGPIVADCVEVTITDTSGNPPVFIVQPPVVINNQPLPVVGVSNYPVTETPQTSYSASPNLVTANEGSQIVFNVIALNVPNGTTLYWSTDGTAVASDFDDNTLSGTTTVTGSLATVTRNVALDATTEGSESVRLKLYTDSARTNLVATSDYIVIIDSSKNPTYSVLPSITRVEEGGVIVFNTYTTDVLNGTALYWSIVGVGGTVNSSDFSDGLLTGSLTINNSQGSFTKTLVSDLSTEGTETFQVQLFSDSARTQLVATSSTITILDTSVAPTYSVLPSATTVDEGSSVTFNITTTDVASGTTLYWGTAQVSGTISALDFTDNQLTGSLTILNNIATLSRTLSADASTEGGESFQIQLYTDSARTQLVATSSTVSISDTSKIPTYSIVPSIGAVQEGSSVSFNIATTDVSSGTTLYWGTAQVTGTINASDFTDNQLTGSLTVSNNTATLSRAISADASTEGDESFQIQLYTDSARTQLVATSSTVLISDTSLTIPTYQITPSSGTVNEGSTVTFNITTTSVPNGNVLYWNTQQVSGTINASDFSDSTLVGSTTINSNIASISRTLTSDVSSEGKESFAIRLYSDSARTQLVATSSSVLVSDTSRAPAYSIVPNVANTGVQEGGTVIFNVTTTDVPNGTVLYWGTIQYSGTVNASDFSDSVLVGSVTINSNTASISRTLSNDVDTEGNEVFAITLFTDSARTQLVATSSAVLISDTSKAPTYEVVPNVSEINESSGTNSVTFNVATTNVPNATTLYWGTESVRGTINSSDFSDSVSVGSVIISSGAASIVRALSADTNTEGFEEFRLKLYTDSGRTNLVATSSVVRVNDSSTTPPEPDPQPVEEPDPPTTRGFITTITTYGGLYGSILGREGEAGGVQFWNESLNVYGSTVDQVVQGFFGSPEYQQKQTTAPVELSRVDTSAITTTTESKVYVSETFINGQWVQTAQYPIVTVTTGVGLSGEQIYRVT